MDFIELKVEAGEDLAQMLIAELGEIGFDTFMENPEGFSGYITQDRFSEPAVKEILARYDSGHAIPYSVAVIPKENWNEDWEKNYHPIEVPGRCRIRAAFHAADPAYPLEIVINPKMSFGTGHHATTFLMMNLLLDTGCAGKRVADLGTGTGILAILAKKLGAATVDTTDIDDWCIENSRENFALNSCEDISVVQGTVAEVTLKRDYDLVIANINRNVLFDEMPAYRELLATKGSLFLSGFYEEDLPAIKTRAAELGLHFVEHRVKDAWVAASFLKKG